MRLGIIVTYKLARHPDGTITASDKFMAEIAAYATRWPGPVDVYLATIDNSAEVLGSSPLPESDGQLTFYPIPPETFGFDSIDVLPDVLLTAIDQPLHTVPKRCQALPVATVVGVEYTLKTRLQQTFAERDDMKGRLGGVRWNLGQEARIVGAVRAADGMQANGYPAFDSYRRYANDAMVYLDSRARECAMPSVTQLENRVQERVATDRPLRLAFTGRLEARKGPLETVKVASELRSREVDFTFLIAGGGPQRAALERAAADAGLTDRFEFAGVLDFDSELVPRLRDEVDAFFCPHPQGDPSCTYVETLAAGVPIVGYANEAIRAIARRTEAVTGVEMGNAGDAADVLARWAHAPAELHRRSTAALGFARAHSFEHEYDARVDHFLSLAPSRV